MIRCTLVSITRNHRGLPIRTERFISGDELAIGRGAECKIHLSDPRANMHCAVIRRAENRRLFIDGEGSLLGVGEAYEHNAYLLPGMHLFIGPYEFTVEKISDDDELVLSVELVHALPADSLDQDRSAAISGAGKRVTKRSLAYWLSGIIVVGFLILPLTQSLSKSAQAVFSHASFTPASLWDPGALSPGHMSFGSQCFKCHEAPFRPVRNQTCLSCHGQTGGHVRDPHVEDQVFKTMLCTECHREHQNAQPVARQGAGDCVLCHADIKEAHAKSELADIHDFEEDHPDFRLSFKTGIGPEDVRRVVQADPGKLVEKSGINFPHDQHVGLTEVPWDRSTIKDMKCSDCHQAEEGGRRFKPVSMKQHCFACHQDQLAFDLAPEGRKLPHGSESALSDTLRDYYSGLAFKDEKSAEWVNEQLEKVTKSLSSGYGCSYCHTVKPADNADGSLLKIAPVNITRQWFPAAIFPHSDHASFKCSECHKVDESADSADVAIPAIKSCKQCHTGEQRSRNKITSNCIACHDFHVAPAGKISGHAP